MRACVKTGWSGCRNRGLGPSFMPIFIRLHLCPYSSHPWRVAGHSHQPAHTGRLHDRKHTCESGEPGLVIAINECLQTARFKASQLMQHLPNPQTLTTSTPSPTTTTTTPAHPKASAAEPLSSRGVYRKRRGGRVRRRDRKTERQRQREFCLCLFVYRCLFTGGGRGRGGGGGGRLMGL